MLAAIRAQENQFTNDMTVNLVMSYVLHSPELNCSMLMVQSEGPRFSPGFRNRADSLN